MAPLSEAGSATARPHRQTTGIQAERVGRLAAHDERGGVAVLGQFRHERPPLHAPSCPGLYGTTVGEARLTRPNLCRILDV